MAYKALSTAAIGAALVVVFLFGNPSTRHRCRHMLMGEELAQPESEPSSKPDAWWQKAHDNLVKEVEEADAGQARVCPAGGHVILVQRCHCTIVNSQGAKLTLAFEAKKNTRCCCRASTCCSMGTLSWRLTGALAEGE
mgnify:CR=1 FL=1